MLPVKNPSPTTSKEASGESVPMPTFEPETTKLLVLKEEPPKKEEVKVQANGTAEDLGTYSIGNIKD